MAVLGSVGGPASRFYEALVIKKDRDTFKGLMDRLTVNLSLFSPLSGLEKLSSQDFL